MRPVRPVRPVGAMGAVGAVGAMGAVGAVGAVGAMGSVGAVGSDDVTILRLLADRLALSSEGARRCPYGGPCHQHEARDLGDVFSGDLALFTREED
jgi:hypothetical protein